MRGRSTTWSRRAAARSASQVSCRSASEGLHRRLVSSLVGVCVILTGLCLGSAWSKSGSHSQVSLVKVCVTRRSAWSRSVSLTGQSGQGLCRTGQSCQGLCHTGQSCQGLFHTHRSSWSRSVSQVSLAKVCVTGQPGQGLCFRPAWSRSVSQVNLVKVCVIQVNLVKVYVTGQPGQSVCHRSAWSRSVSQVNLVKVSVTGQPGHGLCHRSSWSKSVSQVSLVKVCVSDQSVLVGMSVTCLPSYSPGLPLLKHCWKHSMPVFSVNWLYLLGCNFNQAEEWTFYSQGKPAATWLHYTIMTRVHFLGACGVR